MLDEVSKEYYKKYIHKNVGAKGTIEYFRVVDLTEHDERVRADERAEILATIDWLINSYYSSKEFELFKSNLFELLKEQKND